MNVQAGCRVLKWKMNSQSLHCYFGIVILVASGKTDLHEELLFSAVGKEKYAEMYEKWPGVMATHGFNGVPTHSEIVADMFIQYVAEEIAKQ